MCSIQGRRICSLELWNHHSIRSADTDDSPRYRNFSLFENRDDLPSNDVWFDSARCILCIRVRPQAHAHYVGAEPRVIA